MKKGKGEFEEPEKNRYYLMGEYNRMLGNNELARKYLAQAYKVNVISSEKKVIVFIIIIDLILFCFFFLLWTRAKRQRILKLIFTSCLIIIFALCSIYVYFLPDIIQRKEQLRNYYDTIIMERIKLLSEQSK